MDGLGQRLRQWNTGTVALAVILIVAAALRLCALGAESLWFDEAYSVWVSRHSVAWHIALSMQRIFPPLYYLCLHFWLRLGSSEFVVRALSALIGLGSIAAAYAVTKQLFDQKTALVSALLLAISPLHLWYSQEARMYILMAALGLCSAYFMLLTIRHGTRRQWVAYVISTALLMNTHYFAIFLVPFQNAYVLYLLLRKRTHGPFARRWLLSQVLVGLLSAVGLAGIFSSESTYWWGLLDTWHGAPGLAELLNLWFSFSLGTTVRGALIYWSGLLVFGVCLASSWLILRRNRVSLAIEDGLVFATLYLVVPLGTVFLLSQFQSFWVLRYIFPFLPAYCILVARGLTRMPNRSIQMALLAAIVLLSLWPIANTYRYEQKENWRAAVQYIHAQEEGRDVIILVDEDIWLPFEHYYRGETRRVGISRVVGDRDLLAARVGMLLPSYERIWLVLSHTDNFALKDYLSTSRFTEPVLERQFTQVEVDLFAVRPQGTGSGG